jgi:hypothetical protein
MRFAGAWAEKFGGTEREEVQNMVRVACTRHFSGLLA